MRYSEAIQSAYPSGMRGEDWEVENDGEQNQRIIKWMNTTGLFPDPQPTHAELFARWMDFLRARAHAMFREGFEATMTAAFPLTNNWRDEYMWLRDFNSPLNLNPRLSTLNDNKRHLDRRFGEAAAMYDAGDEFRLQELRW